MAYGTPQRAQRPRRGVTDRIAGWLWDNLTWRVWRLDVEDYEIACVLVDELSEAAEQVLHDDVLEDLTDSLFD